MNYVMLFRIGLATTDKTPFILTQFMLRGAWATPTANETTTAAKAELGVTTSLTTELARRVLAMIL
jgi:hypothetical protein